MIVIIIELDMSEHALINLMVDCHHNRIRDKCAFVNLINKNNNYGLS